MGISSLPDPSPVGFLCIILINTAHSISIFRSIARFVIDIIGIHLSPQFESIQPPSESYACDLGLLSSDTFKREFQKQVPPTRFGSVFDSNSSGQECLVCLARFEEESTINHLRCGHVFHQKCLDRWLDYWNVTCPLCRAPLVLEEEEEQEDLPSPIVSDEEMLTQGCY